MLFNEEVRLAEFDEGFFRLSGVWLCDPEIRHLTDTPEISDIERETWYRQLPDRRDYLIYGVTCNGVPVGVCGLKNITKGLKGEYWGFIGDKTYWGKGIGGEMIRFIEKVAVERGLQSIFLKVIRQNPRAIKLYAKHGFKEIESQDKAGSIVMEKGLRLDTTN